LNLPASLAGRAVRRVGDGRLGKMAGEPMDVLVGDKLVARGEVVVFNQLQLQKN
jgi:hypothetical protein